MSPTLAVRIARKTREAADVCAFELVPEAADRLPSFSPEAHVDVYVPGGTLRQYSLCNDADETHRYLIGVLRAPDSRGGSEVMHDRVQVGDVLKIGRPRNQFPLLPASHSLLIAGGIGITPLLSMAERLAKDGAPFSLHYCGRARERMAFLERLQVVTFSDRFKRPSRVEDRLQVAVDQPRRFADEGLAGDAVLFVDQLVDDVVGPANFS
jgi:vanillate O-demethylase ferredoxin subunit